MDIFSLLIFIRLMAVAVGVGGSLTREFLIIESLKDGAIDPSENRLIKALDGLLRSALVAFFISTVFLLLLYKLNGGLSIFSGTAAYMELTLIAVLGALSIFTEADVFPYSRVSAVATVSWSVLFFFEAFGSSISSSYAGALLFYVLVASFGIFLFENLRKFSRV